MRVQQAVWTETKKIAIGVSILSLIMIMAFVGLGQFDYTVPLGALLGACGAVCNFFLMALTVQKITEEMHGVRKKKETGAEADPENEESDLINQEAQEEDALTPDEEADLKEQTDNAKRKMMRSYYLRLVMMIAIGCLGLLLPFLHPVAVLLPFLFPRVVITINGFFSKTKEA